MESNTLAWNHLRKVLEEGTQYLLDRSRSGLPDNYELRNKISFTLSVRSSEFQITFNAPEYWKYVNSGRGPGKMPPIDTMVEWIERRNITPKAVNGKLPTIRSLAFLIARSIGKNGVKGNSFYDIALEDFESIFSDRIADAITEDISEQIDEFLKPIGTSVK